LDVSEKRLHHPCDVSILCLWRIFLEDRHVVTHKVQVSFTDKQWELISSLKGEFGDGDSDVVRSIVISWLAEKSFISTVVKNRINLGEVRSV
jgi:hypothetical protein